MKQKNLTFRISIMICIFLLTVGLLFSRERLYAQVDFSGYMFGDYFYVAKNHNQSLEGQNGFWYRRIYLTADKKISDEISSRVRLELNSPGDFQTKDKMKPFVKDAYISWKRNNHNIIFGLSPTPTFELIEKVWGYRSVEKTPLDLQKYSSSRDFGITFSGTLDKKKKVNYNLMFANGSGDDSETDKGKKVLFSLSVKNDAGWILEGYADIDDRPQGKRWHTLQGFGGYNGKDFRAGVQFSRQTRRLGTSGGEDNLEIASVFMAGKLSSMVSAFARYDRNFDPNSSGSKISYIPFDPSVSSSLIIAGLDFSIDKNVNIIPNAEIIVYDESDSGVKPDSDFVPRITMYFKF